MKIAVLFGSPKKNGNTARLLNLFLSGLEKYLNNTKRHTDEIKKEIIYAYDQEIKPCTGCGHCHNENGKCVFDDMDKIKYIIRSSDLLIIATPIYNYSFPAPLKAIIDRFECYFDKGNIFNSEQIKLSPSKGVLLATAGSSGKYSFDLTEKQAKMTFLMLNANYIGSLMVSDTDSAPVEKIDNRKAIELYNKILN